MENDEHMTAPSATGYDEAVGELAANRRRIAIVGAGITGLALAHELARRGLDFVVLEAAPEAGGVMRSLRAGGQVLEMGPQRTRLTAHLSELIDEFDLRDELLLAPPGLPLFVFRNGRLRRVPFSLGEAIRTDLISWTGKLRVLLEPLTRGERTDESVADFLVRKFGWEPYQAMLGPLYGGLYASDPKDMLMRLTLRQALQHFGVRGSLLRAMAGRSGEDPAPACSFRGGMRALTDALHRRYRDRVRLNTPVLGAAWDGDRIVLDLGGDRLVCDELVLTSPADVTAGILNELAPDAAGRLARLTYNPLAVVHLRSDAALHGMGYQVAFGERLETRGVTFNASLFDRQGIYTAYLGGAKNPAFVRLPDIRIGAVAAAEFEHATGSAADVVHVARVRMPAWDRSWTALEGITLPAHVHLASNYESRAGVPGRLLRARQLAARLAGAHR